MTAKVKDVTDLLAEFTEVDVTLRRRAEYATDASNYRVPPSAVIFPRSREEAERAVRLALEHKMPITTRGAGTSVAGNAIGPGLVMDFSRHMNKVLEINAEEGWARVEPGAIMTDLQAQAAPYGLWFGPDPSTKNRATIGGMIGNNACGPHALTYGRTSDNVISLDILDGRGRKFTAGAGTESVAQVPGLKTLIDQNLAVLRTEFGRFVRQVSGYSLEHLLPEKGSDLAKALVGSEGTCAVVLEAKVALKPVPKKPILLVLSYPTMVDAAADVERLLPLKPLALEGMDARLVEVVRQHTGSVPELPEGEGWLFCEVGEDDASDISAEEKAQLIADEANCLDYRIVPDAKEAAALWRIRADGVGLAGRTPGGNQAWPGWEDAAVPPKNLGPYLEDFENLMAQYDIVGLPYGHFGDGCVHVRMDFPFGQPGGVNTFEAFMEDAAALVSSYGGSISGEHGDGRARGALLPHMYSDAAINLFEQFKALFDPENLLNPGVLVEPAPITEGLRRPQARQIEAEGFAFIDDDGDFTSAVHRCVGVAKCRGDNFAFGDFMCPSYQATKDEKDVTRGRARILQDLTRGAFHGDWAAPEVAASLDLCLSCKACGTDCPAGVDMSMYKSEVTYRRYKGRLRPMNHYVLGWLPRWAKLVTTVPAVAAIADRALTIQPLKDLVFRISGLDSRREMTSFTTQRFSRWFKRTYRGDIAGSEPAETSSYVAGRAKQGQKNVILWADSFSEYLDPSNAEAMVKVLQSAGFTVRIPSQKACCGLTWISTGQLEGAKKRLRGVLDVLGPAATQGVPIIGVEPSCTAVLRSDLLELLPNDPRAGAVSEMTMTLAELLTDERLGPDDEWFDAHSLEGLKVITQPHCHQYAVMGYEKDMEVFRRLGCEVQELAGCCGLAGNFGMEKGHYDMSVKVAENGLLPALREAEPGTVYVADGYSCRTQASQLADVSGIALAQLIRSAVEPVGA